jgi:prepilin-type N-terminal cleavage/methylation domain-containing protein
MGKQPRKPKRPGRDQKGFTLLEIVIAVAIAGLVVAAAAGAIVQLVQSSDTTAHMLAVRQVQQAGYWVSTDALQAQNITTGPNNGFPLNLTCAAGNVSDPYNITYTYSFAPMPSGSLNQLQRSDGATNKTVARYLTNNTIPSWDKTAGVLTFTVEASAMGARGPETETRTYEVTPRAPEQSS